MKQLQRYFLILIAAVFVSGMLASCEEIVDAEGLPYEEKLVIHSILYADSAHNYVRISRTLPVNETFDTSRAYIRDASGSINDGTVSFPLEYIGAGGVYRVTGLRPVPGRDYHLNVSWNGLNATASTSIPTGVSLDSISLVEDTLYEGMRQFRVMTIATLPAPYSASFEVFALSDDWVNGSWTNRLYDHRDAENDGKLYVRENLYQSRGDGDVERLVALAYFMAPGYKEYYETGGGRSDEFGNPVPVRWNVEGDAIGICFGCTKVEKVQELD